MEGSQLNLQPLIKLQRTINVSKITYLDTDFMGNPYAA